MNRLYIMGAPASGKSTMARHATQELGLPLLGLDSLFWDDAAPGYGVRRHPAQRDRLLTQAVNQKKWVLEGVYWKWCAPVFKRADEIWILDVPLWVRQKRLFHRFMRRKLGTEPSQKKESLGGLMTTALWNARWDQDERPHALKFLEPWKHKVTLL